MARRVSNCGYAAIAAVAAVLVFGGFASAHAEDCREFSYRDQRDLLVQKLERDGYSARQSKFLMWLSDLTTGSILDPCLTDEGRQCGGDGIKGAMLQCTRHFMDRIAAESGMTPKSAGMDDMKPMARYGRTRFAVRELLAISAMEACSASAKQRFFTLPQRGVCLMDMDATPP
jgi:hypothetical protein